MSTPRQLDPVFAEDLGAVYRGETGDRLPQSLMATAPEEVATAVLVEWSTAEVGTCTDGAEAYRLGCTVRVPDFAGKKVASWAIISALPPHTKSGAGDQTGDRCYADLRLRAYLQAVPAYASSSE